MGVKEKAEKLFRMATNLPFEEVRDDRDETSVPELAQVAELRDTGNYQDAIGYAEALMKMYPNNDLVPFMIAYMYYQREYPEKAIEIAVEAIPRCPRKYRLYSVAGLAQFGMGRLPEAIVWWSRSVVAQCGILDFQEEDPFLHLAHAASVVGETRLAEKFFNMVDSIDQGKRRLKPHEVDPLIPLRKHWSRDPLVRVLQHIVTTYNLA